MSVPLYIFLLFFFACITIHHINSLLFNINLYKICNIFYTLFIWNKQQQKEFFFIFLFFSCYERLFTHSNIFIPTSFYSKLIRQHNFHQFLFGCLCLLPTSLRFNGGVHCAKYSHWTYTKYYTHGKNICRYLWINIFNLFRLFHSDEFPYFFLCCSNHQPFFSQTLTAKVNETKY